ncbi:hypothetical protein B0H34DRAFT_111202 [Crassisporium funariophilum]|nr:hypothetical protein B0H34DRAFT_111202 [Crassisporium funariophilum]
MEIDHCLWFSTSTLLVFDYVCTLKSEVSYVWPCRRSIGLILFYLNRYLPFLDLVLLSYLKFIPTELTTCGPITTVALWIVSIGMVVSQLIIILRTYAMWGRKRSIFFLLAALTIIIMASVTAIMVIQTIDMQKVVSMIKAFGPKSQRKAICVFHHPPQQVDSISLKPLSCYLLICMSEMTIVLLTIIKANQHLRQSSSAWVDQLYKNGILYGICMFFLSLMNSTIPFTAPSDLKIDFLVLQHVLHSIFSNRVIFLILQNRIEPVTMLQPYSYEDSVLDVLTTLRIDTMGGSVDMGGESDDCDLRTQAEWIR